MIKLKKTTLSDGGVHLILESLIDDKPIRMVLDTGASHSVLDLNWAKENLDKNEIKQADDPAYGINSSVEVHKADVNSITIGDLNIKNRMLALIDFTNINTVYKKEKLEPIQGILGGDILSDYQAVIDYGCFELSFDVSSKNV